MSELYASENEIQAASTVIATFNETEVDVAGQSNEDKEGEKDGIDEAQEEGHQMLRFL